MLFVIAGYLKPGAEEHLVEYRDEFNEHLGPGAVNVPVAGALRDEAGRRVGYLGFFEGEAIEDARRWLQEGPFFQAHLYDRTAVYEFKAEVGRIAG